MYFRQKRINQLKLKEMLLNKISPEKIRVKVMRIYNSDNNV